MNEIFLQKLIQERYKSRFLGLFQSATRPHVLGSRCCYSNNLTSRPVLKTMQSTLKEKLKNAIIQARQGGQDDRGIFICGRRRNRRKRNKRNGQNKRRLKQTVEMTSSKCNSPKEVISVGDSKCIKSKESLTYKETPSCETFEDDTEKDTADKESLPDSGIGAEEDEDAGLRYYRQASSLESLNINSSNDTEDEDGNENPDDEDKEQDINRVSDILIGGKGFRVQEELLNVGIELDDEDQKMVVEHLTECSQIGEGTTNEEIVKVGETGKNDAYDLDENERVFLEELDEDEDVVLFDRKDQNGVYFDTNGFMKGIGKPLSTSFSYKDLLQKEHVSEVEEEEDTTNNIYQRSVTPITKAPKAMRFKPLPPAQRVDESSTRNDRNNDRFVCCHIL